MCTLNTVKLGLCARHEGVWWKRGIAPFLLSVSDIVGVSFTPRQLYSLGGRGKGPWYPF